MSNSQIMSSRLRVRNNFPNLMGFARYFCSAASDQEIQVSSVAGLHDVIDIHELVAAFRRWNGRGPSRSALVELIFRNIEM